MDYGYNSGGYGRGGNRNERPRRHRGQRGGYRGRRGNGRGHRHGTHDDSGEYSERRNSWREDHTDSAHRDHPKSDSAYRDGSHESRGRGPRGLRGRAIGMWFAERSKKKAKDAELQNRPYIQMDKSKEHNITRLLSTIRAGDDITPQPSRSYQVPGPSHSDSDDDSGPGARGQNVVDRVRPALDNTESRDRRQGASFDQYIAGLSAPVSESVCRTSSDHKLREADDSYIPLQSTVSAGVADSWEDYDDGADRGVRSLSGAIQPATSYCLEPVLAGGSTDHAGPSTSHSTMSAESEDDDDVTDEELQGLAREFEQNAEWETSQPGDDIDMDPLPTAELFQPEDGLIQSDFLVELYENKKANRRSDTNLNELCQKRDLLDRIPTLDRQLQRELDDKQNADRKYNEMLEFRKKLPSYHMRKEILRVVTANQVTVISGETGCGKTTQVSQFILDDCIDRGNGSLCRVVCTQPRRISAISVAERVADERAEGCGAASVGYQIRLDAKRPREQGSILYCTTGILLQWLVSDPWLCKTSHVILDEIHERDLQSDFLMIILRDLIRKRSDLKLILMSATLNAEMFSKYFGSCPMLNIPGFTFPVTEYLLEDIVEITRYHHNDPDSVFRPRWMPRGKKRHEMLMEQEEKKMFLAQMSHKYSRQTLKVIEQMNSAEIDLELCARLIDHIVRNKPDGAILVFMPGWEQIKKLNDNLNRNPMFNTGRFVIIPLHSLMPTINQRQVFNRPPPGVRKIIIATNIAETSITIDDVVYVIDCGKIKLKNFDADSNISTLEPEWVSRANARQRRGRAGRVQPGECYHLYSAYQEAKFADYQLPEILRTQLEELCLQIKLLKLGGIEAFVQKAMQPPAMKSLHSAIKNLQNLNALDVREDLTPLGYHLAKMPLDPHTAKMLLFGAMFCCLDPILTIAASLSFKDAFYIPMGKEMIADQRRRQLAEGSQSDHIMLANAYRGWERSCGRGTSGQYCRDNFLSVHTLKMLKNMRQQFAQLLHNMKFVDSSDPRDSRANTNCRNEKLVKAIVCAGLYPNVARIKPGFKLKPKKPTHLQTINEHRVMIHPKSVNYNERQFSSSWFIYHLKMKTTKIFLYDCSLVSPYPLLFFGWSVNVRKDHGQDCIVVDDWIVFRASRRIAHLVVELRRELDKLLESKISNPGVTSWAPGQKEGALMRAILDLITTEECQPTREHFETF